MSDIPALLQPLKDRLEGLTDLCPEHLRQGIRHLQRNCDIECNVHEDDTSWDACKQPDRYDGARMAHALAESAKLIAAIEQVAGMHVMEFIEDGQYSRTRCEECLYEQTDDEPCPTVAALTQALGGDTA